MEIIMYGINACPDCVEAVKVLEEKGADFTYLEFSEKTDHLKSFLKHRDASPLFAEAKENGNIGIPCFEYPDGTITLSLEEVLEKLQREGKYE